jgi:uncharacterized protein (TIGR02453 family)
MSFTGFTQETEQFFWGIRLNNNRQWFQAHKADYQTYAYTPMKELCSQVQAGFLARHPELELNARVTRIYRDMRLVRDGRLYKDHLWFTLYPPKDEEGIPHAELYFGVEPEGYGLGVGYYWMPPAMMECWRSKLLAEPKRVEALTRRLQERPEFQIDGEEYKRPKGQVSPGLAPWYNRKNVSLWAGRSYQDGLCSTPALVDNVLECFEWLMPYYRFFRELETEFAALGGR